jgi:hypothetical protein
MKILMIISLSLMHLVKQVWLFPQTVAQALRQKRQQALLNENEVERLDRLRNPSKYLGK